MGKIAHTEFVYNELCFKEFKSMHENRPEKIERILFLMQYEALKEGKNPVYKYKTYIDGGTIQIKYLSDLLRVMPLTEIIVAERDVGYTGRQEVIKNREEIRKYAKLTNDKINELVAWVLENEEFDSKYFVYEIYRNKKRRLFARIAYYTATRHFLKAFAFLNLTMFFAASIIASVVFIMLLPKLMSMVDNFPVEVVITAGLLPIFIGILWLIWVWRWTRPIQYEIDNHYEI